MPPIEGARPPSEETATASDDRGTTTVLGRETYLAFGTPNFSDEEVAEVTRVLRSGWVGMGPEVLAFEQELAAYVGAPEVVSVSSCTAALFLALLTEGIGPGDEVVVPSLTWCATANAALYLGATPVFCDLDPASFCPTPETVLAAVTPRTRAVIVVHYGGLAIDVAALRAALPPEIALIEDAAHALGGRYPDGRPVGSSGNPVCFSFYANKNLSTAEGGAIVLSDPDRAERLRSLRMSGYRSDAWARYIRPGNLGGGQVSELGYKMNYTDLQAAIGRVQLRRLDRMQAHRAALVARYLDRLRARGLALPFQRGVGEDRHAHHLLVCLIDSTQTGHDRGTVLRELRRRNYGASVHYAPLHRQDLYADGWRTPLPVTDHLAEQILTLPISASMALTDVDGVVDTLADILRQSGAPHD